MGTFILQAFSCDDEKMRYVEKANHQLHMRFVVVWITYSVHPTYFFFFFLLCLKNSMSLLKSILGCRRQHTKVTRRDSCSSPLGWAAEVKYKSFFFGVSKKAIFCFLDWKWLKKELRQLELESFFSLYLSSRISLFHVFSFLSFLNHFFPWLFLCFSSFFALITQPTLWILFI